MPKQYNVAWVAKGDRVILHWSVDQDAEQKKYHVFVTFKTVSCTGTQK